MLDVSIAIDTRPPARFGLSWRDCGRRDTRQGPRHLYEAAPTEAFSAAWKSQRNALRSTGYGFSRDDDGTWSVNFWARPSAAAVHAAAVAKAAAVEASRATDAAVEIPAPEGRSYLPYQRAGIAYAMQRDGALIGDEMGLGKTIQAIGVANATGARTILIVCPASLKLNWARELGRWLVADLPVHVIEGGKATFPDLTSGGVVIINYDVAHAYADQLRAVSWDLLVADEAHYLKGKETRRTRSVFGGGKTKTGPAIAPIAAKRRLLLTGTPANSRPSELFPLLHYLAPQAWPSFFPYAQRYCNAHRDRNGFWDFDGASHQAELQEKLRATVMVRRLKADVLTELPPKLRQIMPLPADTVALRRLLRDEQAAHDTWERLREAKDAGAEAAFDQLSLLREQVGLAKAPLVAEHVLQDAGPVVAFAHHRSVVAAIEAALVAKGRKVVLVTGDMDAAERQASVDVFQSGDADVILGTLGAMGVGLTLTRSAHVVIGELDWVPSTLSQAEDRCHRIGQQGSVHVEHLVFEGSLDSRLVEVLVEKQKTLDAVLDARPAPAPVSVDADSAPATAPTKADMTPVLDDAAIAEIEAAAVAAVQEKRAAEEQRRREREVREAAQRSEDATSTPEVLAALRAALATSAWALGASTYAMASALAGRDTLAPWQRVRALELVARMRDNVSRAGERMRGAAVTDEDLARAADPEVRAMALEACRRMSAMDEDHASDDNGMGWSKSTSSLGHSLAAQDNLDEHDAAVALGVLRVHQRQLDSLTRERLFESSVPVPVPAPVEVVAPEPMQETEVVEVSEPPVPVEPEPLAAVEPAPAAAPTAAQERLRRAGELAYGPRWQTDLARDLDIADRTVRRYATGAVPVPDDLWPRIAVVIRARRDAMDAFLAELAGEGEASTDPARDVATLLAGDVAATTAERARREAVQSATIPATDVAYLREHYAELGLHPCGLSGLVTFVAHPDAETDVVNRVATIVAASVEAVVAAGERPAWVTAAQADAAIEAVG